MANTSINEVVGGLGDTGKSKIGYTTTGYEQVLKALKANKLIITRQVQTTTAVTGNVNTQMQYMTYSSLFADTWNENAIEDNDGMLMLGDEPLYQGVLGTKCFGSFIIEGQLMGQQSKKRCVSDKTGLVTPLTDFSLPNDLTPTNVELVGNKIGSSNPFRIGVSLDIVKFVQPFFKKFFGEGSWQQIDSLKKIIAQGKMYAQISVSTKVGNKANVIHAMVTSSHEDPASNVPDGNTVDAGGTNVTTKNIYIPYILLLLSQYNALGKVTLESGDVVGGGKVSFPFNTGNYYHITGAIEGLTPDWIKNYCGDGTGGYNVYSGRVGSDLIGQAGEKRARVRLYLAKDAASGLPDNKQLYEGHYDVTKNKVTQMGITSGALPNGSFRVIIDVGHSKGTSGAPIPDTIPSLFGHRNEYQLNQMAAKQIEKYLTSKGVGVTVLDHPGVQAVDNRNTANFVANNKNDYACLVSVHHNSSGKQKNGKPLEDKVSGSLVNIARKARQGDLSWKLGQKLAIALNNVIKGKNNLKPMPPREGIDELTVLSNSHLMPGALLEIGFLNNRNDVKTISETGYAKIAQFVGDAIIQWYNENKSTN